MAALAAKGADILESGVHEFEPWAAKLLANLGETIASKVRPGLGQIYNAAHEEVRKRQGRLQATERAPVPPAPSVGTQANGDTGQARRVAVANPETRAPRWRMRSLATGLTVAIVVVVGLTAVWIWPDRKLARAKSRELTDAEVGLVPDRRDDLQARPEKADAQAQYDLGVRYSKGDGVPPDLEEAVKWFRKAAEQGLAKAQAVLGCCYEGGQGVVKDEAEAEKWYRKAESAAHGERPGSGFRRRRACRGACDRGMKVPQEMERVVVPTPLGKRFYRSSKPWVSPHR